MKKAGGVFNSSAVRQFLLPAVRGVTLTFSSVRRPLHWPALICR
ncbi:MAG: hypothetical protein WCI81_00835 [Chlorobiaceae bacterium]